MPRRSKNVPPPGEAGPQWRHIERFNSRVMKKLVDKAYGITESHRIAQEFPLIHGNRTAQRQFIHSQVYLPSVHRTVDYLQRVRASTARTETPTLTENFESTRALEKPMTAPLGSNLLSSLLHALQEELLVHYEAEKRQSGALETELWSPRPPQPRTQCQPSPPADSPLEQPTATHSGSFRSHRLTRRMSRRRSEQEETMATPPSDDDEGVLFTDSDTYSLSSGVEGGSEAEERAVLPGDHDSFLSSGTESWSSLESHVLVALEGTSAAQIGSVREPLVVVYDSDDPALFSGTSESSNSTCEEGSAGGNSSSMLGEGSLGEEAEEQVIFLDNGVRVDSMGRAVGEDLDLPNAWGSADTGSGPLTIMQMLEDGRVENGTDGGIATPLPSGGEEGLEDSEQNASSTKQGEMVPEVWILHGGLDDESEAQGVNCIGQVTSPTASDRAISDINSNEVDVAPEPNATLAVTCESESIQLPNADAAKIMLTTPRPDIEKVATNVLDGAERQRADSQQEPQHRYSISSSVAYDDADFEDMGIDDETDSTQGYESFDE